VYLLEIVEKYALQLGVCCGKEILNALENFKGVL
jgi:hypothetical protein